MIDYFFKVVKSKKKKFKTLSFQKGFTLIEFLISIGIITILSSAIILGKTNEERKLALQRMAYQISQDLRQAQEKSLGAEEEKSKCNPQLGYNRFGLSFSKNQNYYLLFVDCNKNGKYDSDEEIGKVSLEKGVEINNLSPSSPLNIIFEPAEPITYINNVQWGIEGIIILKGWNKEKKIKINSAGRIEIE